MSARFYRWGAVALLFLAVAAMMAMIAPAFAQSGTSVSFVPIIEAIAPFIVEAIVAVVTLILLPALYRWLGLQIEAKHRDALDRALRAGAQWGVNQAQARVASGAFVNVRYEAVAQALNYVTRSTPDAIRKFGLTPERLREMIEARLPAEVSGSGVYRPSTEPGGTMLFHNTIPVSDAVPNAPATSGG